MFILPLNRQFLFRNTDVNKPKSIAAAAAIRKMNPEVNVEPTMSGKNDFSGFSVLEGCNDLQKCLNVIGGDRGLVGMPLTMEEQSVLDWSVNGDSWDDDVPAETPNASEVRQECNIHKNEARRDFDEFFQLLEKETEEVNKPCRSVSRRTPIINEQILSQMRTRAHGSVDSLPHVMGKPLEYEKKTTKKRIR